ncbi:MAG: twin-arginine translocation signal domain-containing protein, partial [Filomicrobium sp.]
MPAKFFTHSRRAFLGGASAACAAAALPLPALAVKKNISLGPFEVTTISDGHIPLPSTFAAPKVDPELRKAAWAAAGQTGDTYKSPINVTLIKTPDDLIL